MNDLGTWQALWNTVKAFVRCRCPADGYAVVTVRLIVRNRQVESFAKPSIQVWMNEKGWRKAMGALPKD